MSWQDRSLARCRTKSKSSTSIVVVVVLSFVVPSFVVRRRRGRRRRCDDTMKVNVDLLDSPLVGWLTGMVIVACCLLLVLLLLPVVVVLFVACSVFLVVLFLRLHLKTLFELAVRARKPAVCEHTTQLAVGVAVATQCGAWIWTMIHLLRWAQSVFARGCTSCDYGKARHDLRRGGRFSLHFSQLKVSR